MASRCVLGVDSSTSATKVIAFSAGGKAIAEGAKGYQSYTDRGGWVEQDPGDWWTAFCDASRQVMANPQIDARTVAGIGVTHQRFTFVPVDGDMNPLRRAILWNDIRCTREAADAVRMLGKELIFERTGYAPGQWTLYKILWLKNNEPALYDKIYKVVLVQDYLIYRLTGRLVTPQGAATMTGALDIARPDRWATDVIRGLGVREDVWIDDIVPGGTVVGHVTKQAAAATGLPEGLPVVTGAGDQPCGILGAGITDPGELGINGGTSCTNEMMSRGLPERKHVNYFIELSPSGEYIVENYITSGGSALMNWYKNNFGHQDVERAGKEAKSPWDLIYGQAAETSPGNDGMMMIPYFQGANAPYWDMKARGLVCGLHLDYGRPHLVRSVMEGLAYESRRQMELMEAGTATQVQQIRMYGGSARSELWNQIFADVLNRPLLVPETAETTALGAAISAAVGCGMHAGFKAAADAMVCVKTTYRPIAKNVGLYERYYDKVYVNLYDRVQDLMHAVFEINAEA